jgi:hypothetical protein
MKGKVLYDTKIIRNVLLHELSKTIAVSLACVIEPYNGMLSASLPRYLSNQPFFQPNIDKLMPIASTPNTNNTGKIYVP